MSNQTLPSGGTKQRPALFFVLTVMLIGLFLWKVFATAHEYSMRTEQVMTMLFDAGMVLGLFAVKNSGPKAVWWTALIAGIGMFAIRLTGDAAWWTGRLTYSIN